MTLDGTNGYLIDAGDGTAIVIDPGPAIAEHLTAFVEGARSQGQTIAAILVTHGHPDHYPGAAPLATATGAPVYAHHAAHFAHDRDLHDGDRLRFGEIEFAVIDAPGHMVDHVVFVLENEAALFTGDVVVGSGTVVIAPPRGDMRAYQRTLAHLRDTYGDARALYGGHGAEVTDVRDKLDEYIAHRESRERELLTSLALRPQTIPELTATIYAAVDERVWPAAARQLLAYLLALEREGRVVANDAGRDPTPAERALLNPDFAAIAGRELDVAVMRAELGFTTEPEPLLIYALTA